MNDPRMCDVIQHLRHMVRPDSGTGPTDAELVRRWTAARDEAAFELLLWRHGPMVHGVCRRIIRDVHEAEDALQATFLALARKASAIGKREAVAGWLYRVAYRVALAVRERAARRPMPDGDSLAAVTVEPIEDFIWRDLRPVLDEEVNRLALRYRVPFVLRYLEGRTNEEVARELGCPLGTVLSRLGRARERLRARLTRRGLGLAAGALAAGVCGRSLYADVPAGIVGPLVKAASLLAAGQTPAAGLVSTNAVVVAETVLRGMTMSKLKLAIVLVLAVCAIGTGTGMFLHRLNAGQEPGEKVEHRAAGRAPEAPQEGGDRRPGAGGDGRQVPDAERKAAAARDEAALAALMAKAKARNQALELAKKRLDDAEQSYDRLEKQMVQHGLTRLEVVALEEKLRRLERDQAIERERERGEINKWWGAGERKVDPKNVDPKNAFAKEIKELDDVYKQHEDERIAQLIQLRQKLVQCEEDMRKMDIRRDAAKARLQEAMERFQRLEDDSPQADGQAAGLRNVERKIDAMLRDMGELRRAIERQQGKNKTP